MINPFIACHLTAQLSAIQAKAMTQHFIVFAFCPPNPSLEREREQGRQVWAVWAVTGWRPELWRKSCGSHRLWDWASAQWWVLGLRRPTLCHHLLTILCSSYDWLLVWQRFLKVQPFLRTILLATTLHCSSSRRGNDRWVKHESISAPATLTSLYS